MAITHTRQVSDHRLSVLYDLTASQSLVLFYLADKISEQRGSWWHTGQQIAEALNISRDFADRATKLLCELGILSRDRKNRETPYTYRFAWQCPPECSETSHMVARKPDNPMRENPTRGGAKTSQHIREQITEIKEEVKQQAPASFGCSCEITSQGTIHGETCPGYLKLQGSKAWLITKEQNALRWPYMNAEEKQQAHFESMAGKTERDKAKATEQAERLSQFERNFEDSYEDRRARLGELTPAWKQYAKEIHSPTADRSFSAIGYRAFMRFVHYSQQGLSVPPRPEIKDKFNPYPDIKVPGTDID